MSARVAIVAALPREISGLVKGWQAEESAGVRVWWNEAAIAVCAGMGTRRSTVAAGEALARGPVSVLVSTGFAGALCSALRAGTVVRPAFVIDACTGERFATTHGEGTLVTGGMVAGVGEKRRLRSSYGAEIVDMEAAAVARVAAQRGIPFVAVKAVSDEADFELPELARFATASGQFREVFFAFFLAAHPRLWHSARRFAAGAKLASRSLTIELRDEIEKWNA